MKSLLCKPFSKKVLFVSLVHASLSFLNTNVCLANSPSLTIRHPNNLISFTADCQSYCAQIRWSTSSENKKGFFMIERTNDGVNFETITMIQNSVVDGPTAEKHEYSFKDTNPFLGISYYRISEVDSVENRKVEISTIVYTPCENDETINAVVEDNQVTVSVNALTEDPRVCNIAIINNDNKAVLSHVKKVTVGMNSYKIETNLNEGLYNLRVGYRDKRSFNKEIKISSAQ